MATVIIDVSLNSQDATSKANELGKEISRLREAQSALREEGKATSAEYVANAQTLRRLTSEQRAYVEISEHAEGSNNRLRAALSLLTAEYNALSSEERENTEAGRAMQIQIRGISDELKKNENAIGDNRRNVGNYKEAIDQSREAAAEATQGQKNLLNAVSQSTIGFQFGGDALNSVTAQVKAFKQAQNEAKAATQAANDLQIISTGLTNTATEATARATQIGFQFSAGQATEAEVIAANTAATNANIIATDAQVAATEAQVVATEASTNATKVFKVALASTGIGAIVLIVVALLSYLSKFDPIMDKLEQAFAAVGAVVTRVTGIVVDFFTNLKSVGDFLSKIGGILADPIGSFKRLGDEIAETARQAVALKQAQQDLEDQIKIQEVSTARAIQQVKQLQIQARNRALTEKERIALLKQADKLDQDNFKNQQNLSAEKTRLAYEDLKVNSAVTDAEIANIKRLGLAEALRLKDKRRITDEQIDALKAVQLEEIKNQEEVTNREEKRQNQLDALAEKAQQAAEKRAQRAEQLRQKAEEAEQVRLESVVRTNQFIQTERKNEEDEINRDIDARKAKYKEYSVVTQQLEKERTARLRELNAQYQAEIMKSEQETLQAVEDLFISRIQNQNDREIAEIAVQNQRKLAQQDELIAATQERIALGEQGLTQLLLDQQLLRDSILQQGKFEIDAKNKEYEDAKAQEAIDRDQRILDAKIAIQEEERKLTDQGLDLLTQVFGKETALGKTAFLAQKAFAVARIVIDTQQALAANRLAEQVANASLSAIPVIGIGLAIANSVKAQAERTKIIIGGAISAGAVLATAVAGFADGVIGFNSDGQGSMVKGKGTATSDSINARLSNGESVINARSTAMFAPLLSAINEAGGGRPLAPGFAMATGGIAQGGFVTRIDQGIQSTNDTVNLVMQAVKSMPRPIVGVEQIVTGINTRQVTVDNSTI